MRVCFLSTSMGMGGADAQVLSVACELRARGHEVMIVSLTALGPMGTQARRLGIPTESLEMPRGWPDPRGLVRLARLVRRWRPDVVHSHMVHANLMARVLRLIAPVPALVSTIHNVYEGGALRMTGYRISNFLVDHMTIVSEAAFDRYIGEGIVPREILAVVPNGVDTARFRGVPPGASAEVRRSLGLQREFVWLAVGRFEIAKDYPNLLRAFARVHQQEPGSVLLLVGCGSRQRETKALAVALRLDRAVRFLGTRSDVPEIMSAADGYVQSSAWEGMPLGALEAAAAALPIVATDVGGTREVVRQGESGVLVPPGDAEALGRGMLRVAALPESERRAMGRRGREHVHAHYRLERVADRWEALYREVLGRKGLVPAPAG